MSDKKVVIITGSSSGIGRETAHLFASKGFQVVVHGSKSQEKVNKVVDECNKLAPTSQHKSFGIVADFQDPSNGQLVAKRAYEHYGRIDAVICLAAAYEQSDYESKTCFDDYYRLMNINVNSHFRLLLEAAPKMTLVDNASIILISDVTVERPTEKHFAYTMSREALKTLACCFAVEFNSSLRSISVTLGKIKSPRNERNAISEESMSNATLMKRVGTVEEVAQYLWFLSQEATFINGTDVRIDGGYKIKREFTY